MRWVLNIYDVARLAGVSISTASKALNDRKDVSTATKERVMQVAQQIDYHPSHLARGLAQRRTENIGVMALRHYDTPLFTNPFYSRVIEGMEMEATQRNYNLLLSIQPVISEDAKPVMPKMVRERSVDGLVLMGNMPQNLVHEIAERRMPLVVVDSFFENINAEYVVSDNRGGARQAVNYLFEKGHRKIGLVSGPLSDNSFSERREGFLEALGARNLKPTMEAIHEKNRVDWVSWLPAVLNRKDRPTAIFCCNDDHALRLIEVARRQGLKVPGDLSVIGFDDIFEGAPAGLTTILVEKAAMGAKAVQRLMDLMEDSSRDRETTVFPTHLVERDTVGQV